MEPEKPISLEQIRQKVLDRHDMPTNIYIGHLECALRACKERLRYIRNRRCDVARSIVYALGNYPMHLIVGSLPFQKEENAIVAEVEGFLDKDLDEIFVVEGGIQGMIDKLKELVPDPKQEEKNENKNT